MWKVLKTIMIQFLQATVQCSISSSCGYPVSISLGPSRISHSYYREGGLAEQRTYSSDDKQMQIFDVLSLTAAFWLIRTR